MIGLGVRVETVVRQEHCSPLLRCRALLQTSAKRNHAFSPACRLRLAALYPPCQYRRRAGHRRIRIDPLFLPSGGFVSPLTSVLQLWNLYNRLPTSTSADAKAQIELQKEVIRLKREMNATSSQDEFAKWAKLRRSHDKNMAQYDEKSKRHLDIMRGAESLQMSL